MRALIALTPFALLAACATPQQACIAQNSVELRATEAQILKINDTLSRGYAIHKQQVPYTVMGVCFSEERRRSYPCPGTRWRTDERPVAVDLNDQRARLAVLEKKRAPLLKAHQAVVKACVAAHPE